MEVNLSEQCKQHHLVSYKVSFASPHVLPDHTVHTMSEARRDYHYCLSLQVLTLAR